jgi:low temperature requirement protein LtrA
MVMATIGGWRSHLHGTDDTHRVTSLELLFDLVFVYGLTQVTALMAERSTWTGAAEGLIVLGLLWFAWTAYAWLGNQAKADEGLLRLAIVVAMTADFLVALAVPQAFDDASGAALLLVAGLVVARLVHLGVYLVAAGDDAALRRQLLLTTGPVAGWVAFLVAGALADLDTRLVLWAVALAVDYGGIFFSSRAGGWRLNAAGHFAERHGLIVIIALGESLVAIGVGVSEFSLTAAVVGAVLLGISVTVGLWWAYFDVVAPVAERVLERTRGEDRARLARDSYTYLHLPMVVGIVFLALGLKKVVGYVSDSTEHELSDPLTGMPLVALYGGAALYLLALVAFRLRNVRSLNVQRLVVALVLLLLVPVAWQLPALLSLAVVGALVVGLVAYEATHFAEARAAIRHAEGDGGLIPPDAPARP